MYDNGFPVLPPSVMLKDVTAVLYGCHGLTNGANGKVLTSTNRPVADSFHKKGSETD